MIDRGKNGRLRKTKADHGAEDDISSRADGHLWAAIKNNNVEFLIANLFDATHSEGGPLLVPKPSNPRLLSICSHKKVPPLQFAVVHGCNEETISVLLRAGADINATDKTREQSTPLHTACWSADDRSVQVLLRYGADLRAKDAEGRTPLHILAHSTAHALVSHILESADSPVNETDLESRQKVLVDPFELILIRDKYGATPLHTSVAEVGYGNSNIALAIIEFLEGVLAGGNKQVRRKVDQLLRLGTNDGNTVLHALVDAPAGDADAIDRVMQRLLKLNCDPLMLNADQQSVFASAANALHGSKVLFRHLFEHTIQKLKSWTPEQQLEVWSGVFTTLDYEGRPLVHVMIHENNLAAVEGLVEAMQTHHMLLSHAQPWLGDVVAKDGRSTIRVLATTPSTHAEAIASLLASIGAFRTEEAAEAGEATTPPTCPEAAVNNKEAAAEAREELVLTPTPPPEQVSVEATSDPCFSDRVTRKQRHGGVAATASPVVAACRQQNPKNRSRQKRCGDDNAILSKKAVEERDGNTTPTETPVGLLPLKMMCLVIGIAVGLGGLYAHMVAQSS